jgi:hypothetical protein
MINCKHTFTIDFKYLNVWVDINITKVDFFVIVTVDSKKVKSTKVKSRIDENVDFTENNFQC